MSRELWAVMASGLIWVGCGAEAPSGEGSAGAAGHAPGGAAGQAGAVSAGGSAGLGTGAAGGAGGAAGGAAGGSGSAGASGGSAGAAGACAGATPFGVRVVSHEFGPGQSHGQLGFPDNVLGPPSGAGCCNGSLQVASLGIGGWVVIELGDTVVDGPGVDLLVFENAFEHGSGNLYAEPASVAVSEDGLSWYEFPCTATAAPWGHCAGTHPVYANPEENDIDPTDPAVAGGDGFDLSDLGVTRARFVRITDRADLTSSVFDLDAVAVVNGLCSAP